MLLGNRDRFPGGIDVEDSAEGWSSACRFMPVEFADRVAGPRGGPINPFGGTRVGSGVVGMSMEVLVCGCSEVADGPGMGGRGSGGAGVVFPYDNLKISGTGLVYASG